jgi:cell division protein FtsQ
MARWRNITQADAAAPPDAQAGRNGMDRDGLDRDGMDRDGLDRYGMGRDGAAGPDQAVAPDGAAPAGAIRDDMPPPGPRRQGELWRAACFVFAAVAIVTGLAWALLGSSLLVVRSVQVTGVHLVTRAEILGAAGIRGGTPLIRINTSMVARRVERLTPVQSAYVSRAWPDKIVISVQERTPALAVAEPAGFGLVDEFGVTVRQTARKPPAMPLLTAPVPGPGTSLRGSPAVRAAVTVLRELPLQLRHRVKSVSALAASAVTLQLADGVRILWGGSDRAAPKLRELSILMRARARYYDVSDPSVAVTER